MPSLTAAKGGGAGIPSIPPVLGSWAGLRCRKVLKGGQSQSREMPVVEAGQWHRQVRAAGVSWRHSGGLQGEGGQCALAQRVF